MLTNRQLSWIGRSATLFLAAFFVYLIANDSWHIGPVLSVAAWLGLFYAYVTSVDLAYK